MNHLNIIKKKIEELYDLNLSENTRRREYVEARGFFVKIAKDTLRNVTYEKLGDIINKNHATAIHSKKTIENLLTYDVDVQKNYQTLLDSLTINEENLDDLTHLELKRITKSLIKENKLLKLQLQK